MRFTPPPPSNTARCSRKTWADPAAANPGRPGGGSLSGALTPENVVPFTRAILMNQYRQEIWPGSKPWDQHAPPITGRVVNSQARIVINGVGVPGAEVDTDPFVYGVGAQLATGGVVTAVLPRAELKSIQLQFTTRVKRPQRP